MWDLALNSYEGIVKNCKSCEELCIFHGSGKLCFCGVHTSLLLIAFVLSRGAASQLEKISSQFSCWTIKAGKTIFFLKEHRDEQLKPMEMCKIWSCAPTNQNKLGGIFLSAIWKNVKLKIFFRLTQNTLFILKGNNLFHFEQIIFTFSCIFFLFCSSIFLYFLASFQDNIWNFWSEKNYFNKLEAESPKTFLKNSFSVVRNVY